MRRLRPHSGHGHDHFLLRALGRGLLAGLGGTAVMTAVQMIKAKLKDEEPSMAPAQAAEKTLGIEPRTERAEHLLNNAVHWAYGTAWGVARTALAGAGVSGFAASTMHLGALWGAALVMLPRLRLAPPVREWGGKAIASDLALHAVYAYTAGWVYDRLAHRAA